ncbi:MAG: hypothetical protein HS108_07085 [Planctomycetes bacterium]|jgi:hypothetical protein|nr:hypothetical protein [Planctomycetota bacterium]MCL4729806.1 hypothetical protein [Planctomycetota bacterium]
MRMLPAMFGVMLALAGAGCTSNQVLEVNTNKVGSLTSANEYSVRPLRVTFRKPEAWTVTPEIWEAWLQQWQNTYILELRKNCRKSLISIDAEAKPEKAYVLECEIYEMDSGGFAGVGGSGYARARVKITDSADGSVLFEGRLQGVSSTQTSAEGRLNGAVGELAEEIARVLMQGA